MNISNRLPKVFGFVFMILLFGNTGLSKETTSVGVTQETWEELHPERPQCNLESLGPKGTVGQIREALNSIQKSSVTSARLPIQQTQNLISTYADQLSQIRCLRELFQRSWLSYLPTDINRSYQSGVSHINNIAGGTRFSAMIKLNQQKADVDYILHEVSDLHSSFEKLFREKIQYIPVDDALNFRFHSLSESIPGETKGNLNASKRLAITMDKSLINDLNGLLNGATELLGRMDTFCAGAAKLFQKQLCY